MPASKTIFFDLSALFWRRALPILSRIGLAEPHPHYGASTFFFLFVCFGNHVVTLFQSASKHCVPAFFGKRPIAGSQMSLQYCRIWCDTWKHLIFKVSAAVFQVLVPSAYKPCFFVWIPVSAPDFSVYPYSFLRLREYQNSVASNACFNCKSTSSSVASNACFKCKRRSSGVSSNACFKCKTTSSKRRSRSIASNACFKRESRSSKKDQAAWHQMHVSNARADQAREDQAP